jgi:glucosamine-6-phosphate deaminase
MEVLNYAERSLEKLPVTICEDPQTGAIHIAHQIAATIRYKETRGEKTVLGLATGSSPIGVYRELVRMHKTRT